MMKTLDYNNSNTIFFKDSLESIVELKTMCINNAYKIIKYKKDLTYIHYISKINDMYVLIFKIVKKNSKTVKEFNRIKQEAKINLWHNNIKENFLI